MPVSDTTNPAHAITPWGFLPPRIKVLHVTTGKREGRLLSEAFAADSATEILMTEVVGTTAAVTLMREEVFDALLVMHEPSTLDALDFVEGLRAGGQEEPAIILGHLPEQEMVALAYEVGADAYCQIEATTTRTLLWTFARAIERAQLIRENRRLIQADRHRLQQEHQEAGRLLDQQRDLIAELEDLRSTPREPIVETPSDENSPSVSALDDDLPEAVVRRYREMLRTYVIMGSGNLTAEMTELAEMLSAAGITARATMQLHVQVLEELIGGLGNRSARHVMNRADLLVLEVMIHLSEGYRERYIARNSAA